MTRGVVNLFLAALALNFAAAPGRSAHVPAAHAPRYLGRAVEAHAGGPAPPASGFGRSGAGQRARPAARRWRVFRGPDDDFTVEFPGEPRLEEGAQRPGEVAAKRRYSYYGHSLWLSVTFQDLGFPPDSRQANDLGPNIEEVLAAYTLERGGRTIRVRRLARNVLEEERSVPSRQTGRERHVVSRIIQRNSRMYTLGCVPLVDGRRVNKGLCRRFFNSFRVTGPPR